MLIGFSIIVQQLIVLYLCEKYDAIVGKNG